MGVRRSLLPTCSGPRSRQPTYLEHREHRALQRVTGQRREAAQDGVPPDGRRSETLHGLRLVSARGGNRYRGRRHAQHDAIAARTTRPVAHFRRQAHTISAGPTQDVACVATGAVDSSTSEGAVERRRWTSKTVLPVWRERAKAPVCAGIDLPATATQLLAKCWLEILSTQYLFKAYF